jgi:hypothetical protein
MHAIGERPPLHALQLAAHLQARSDPAIAKNAAHRRSVVSGGE